MRSAANAWRHKHLLGLEALSAEDIRTALDLARTYQAASATDRLSVASQPHYDVLRDCVVVNIFFEDSTRTRVSFELAASRLGAKVIEFSVRESSTQKGESLVDTARTVWAMGVDALVLRHPSPGAPQQLAGLLPCCIINAGDGSHEHPTQGLLDLLTIEEERKSIAGLHVAIVGDIVHSRVARSALHGLRKLGADVTLVGPTTLVPQAFEKLGARVTHDFESVLPSADVVMMLRIQKERITSNVFPSVREYVRYFALDQRRLARCKPDVLVMHPGPMNRGIEIAPAVADGDRSRVLRQVSNGVAVRMAALTLCHRAARASV